MLRSTLVCALLLAALPGVLYLTAAEAPVEQRREQAARLVQQGNWRDAWEIYSKLTLDPENAGKTLASDYEQAVNCLTNLQRVSEIDDFREQAVEIHADDWRLLQQAAQSLIEGEHFGFIVAGEFERGQQRGGGEYAQSQEWDRTRALQLYQAASELLIVADAPAEDKARFFSLFGQALMFMREANNAWMLQDLTDLATLPDYERGYRWGRGGSENKGAPVDADGKPVYYSIPESWDAAKNDGERWRWTLEQMATSQPTLRDEADWSFAGFLHGQFGVQTMRQWGIVLPSAADPDGDVNESGPYALTTLEENETIARLANGVKRFELPDEFNFIRIYQKLAAGEGSYAEQAHAELAQIFENRQQYPKAADWWKKSIERFGDNNGEGKRQALNQIIGNWGQFETTQSQPAGENAQLDFRFRNGNEVSFTAHAIKFEQLLTDVKAYIKSAPNQLDWQQLQIDNLGYRLVEQNERKYVGEQVAQWKLDLEPRPNHFDRRVAVEVPIEKAGAYLVVAKMADGNTSRIILWLNDTAIVKKPLNGQVLYYVADAVTGQPVEKANVEFFGWRQEHIPNTQNRYRVVAENFAEFTDREGMIVRGPKEQDPEKQWVIIARTNDGRFAHLGFTGVWYGERHDQQYRDTKAYAITDRPVYRPEQTVQFKFWMREAKYDKENTSRFAELPFTVKINDPQGTEVFSQEYTTDKFGGLAGEYVLPENAPLGQYGVHIEHAHGVGGGGSFRVEEYKKPEFEVLIEAPDVPVMLGDTVTATIRAKYYFGAPVKNATVKYKVERTPHDARWFPPMPWDWLYGEGYWWFASDASWYPGFSAWGTRAPRMSWIPWNPEPPELVLDQEVPIGEDGTVQVEIDTQLAKLLHGDEDHRYTITAEVVDASRRTIVGTGEVLVARKPFEVFAWTNRGHYQVGDDIQASFAARTIDGKPVEGTGKLELLRITYEDHKPVEKVVQEWELNPGEDGTASQQIKASEPGQYRLSYKVTAKTPDVADPTGLLPNVNVRTIEGGYLFVIRGEGFDGSEFEFSDLELVADKTDYAPGETVQLMVNTNREDSRVLLFVRPSNGIYDGRPQLLKLDGKSTTVDIGVVQKDMPNFFVEAVTIANGEVHTVVKEIVVPPEDRVLNIELAASSDEYQPGEKAEVQVKVTDADGEPYAGSVVLSVYDRAVEYISGGSNVEEIKAFFWKWRREHHPSTEHNLDQWFWNLVKSGETGMANLGVFGDLVADLDEAKEKAEGAAFGGGMANRRMMRGAQTYAMPAAAMPAAEMAAPMADAAGAAPGGGEEQLVQPTVRTEFADTAYWNAAIATDKDGLARVSFDMPENLSSWKLRAWGMGHGTRVGEASKEVVTSKNLIVRLQAPRFFVETDEVVLSAIVHNYLETEKQAKVELSLNSIGGGIIQPMSDEGADASKPLHIDISGKPLYIAERQVTIPAGGEVRVDWRCKVVAEGDVVVGMKALTDEESDAMSQTFPVYVHGFLKTESFSGVVRADESTGAVEFTVPEDRRPEQTRLEVRYSPTLAGAMVDALPYLVEYPYGCTEQTLNRFVPTVITQNILRRMQIDLKAVQEKRTNLNAQEIGDDLARAKQWQQWDRNPVFDEAEVEKMVKQGVKDLTAMQLSDGGWGWFSGFGEHSYPHTTAVVVHGLQLAQQNEVAIVPGVLDRGVAWLKRHQAEQVEKLQLYEKTEGKRGKAKADNVDALVYMVLVDSDVAGDEMQRFLYRDRLDLALYSQALFGLALHKQQDVEKRDMIIKNLDQFLKVDDENQTAYLDLPNRGYWWHWYGSNIEANAFYLKLLTAVNPQDPKASGLVKYLLNNRKHATYWESTRDTAYCIEALADYLVASGEAEPNLQVEVWLDGKLQQTVEITPEVLFDFDNSFVIEGADLTAGKHRIELRKKRLESRDKSQESRARDDKVRSGLSTLDSPLYFNAYLTNFSTEDFITAAGLEIKVARKFYKLVQREDATNLAQGAQGQAVDEKVLKYDREELENLESVESGDLIEIELEIDSKNDYEYVVFEDLKAAGCEPVELQSGYTEGGLGAYVEFRDEKVAFFLRTLARGKHSVSYRLRAEIPGQFSALPTRAYAMYAPELKGNSDEMKLRIVE